MAVLEERAEIVEGSAESEQRGAIGALTLNSPAAWQQTWETAMAPLPAGSQLATFLGNHDRPRIFSTLQEDPRRLALASAFLLTAPGTPILYYGDEVGVPNGLDVVVDRRD